MEKIIGLTDEEVIKNRKNYGSNILIQKHPETFTKKFIESLGDPIIKILLVALIIKVIFLIKSFDWYETIGIIIAIFLSSLISTISELGSEQAFIRLQEEASRIKSKVKRNNNIELISNEEIVVNDIVILSSGDKVPADGIIISGNVSVDMSSLNGESKESHYTVGDSLYMGSIIVNDNCILKITKVGSSTIYGNLSLEIQEKSPIGPLKLRLTKLAKLISRIGYIGAILAFISYMFKIFIINNNYDLSLIISDLSNFSYLTSHILYALTLCVSIIIVSVPEGLPMMITLVLSTNMRHMLKNNVLVRKLVGIETSGNINILFTDKTGTLTKGNLSVVGILDANLNIYENEQALKKYPKLHELFKLSMIANNESMIGENNEIIGGNSTDKSLLEFFHQKEIDVKIINHQNFNSKNKYSSVDIIKNNENITLIKGAYEKLLYHCVKYYDSNANPKYLVSKTNIIERIESYTKEGIRVLCLTIEKNNIYHLLGFVLIKDELRKETIPSIDLITSSGIQVIMITGDNLETSKSIAKESKIITDEKNIAIESSELNKLTDLEIATILPNLRVVARSLPEDKSKLVKIAQSLGLVVGMTGDGINDAPALKKADVGFAMGSGTEVAKEASDIVILDNNLNSIANAILYGRTIFKSIRKFIIFQLTVNLCALSISIIGPFIGVESPLTVIQMLWINMIMDTFAGLAFAYEKPRKQYMEERPKKKDTPIINKYMYNEILFTGGITSIILLMFLKCSWFHEIFNIYPKDKYFMTAFFVLFVFTGIFNCFNARTNRLNLFSNILKNKVFLIIISLIIIIQLIIVYYGGDVFRTTKLGINELSIIILTSLIVIPIDIIRKIFLRLIGIKGGV